MMTSKTKHRIGAYIAKVRHWLALHASHALHDWRIFCRCNAAETRASKGLHYMHHMHYIFLKIYMNKSSYRYRSFQNLCNACNAYDADMSETRASKGFPFLSYALHVMRDVMHDVMHDALSCSREHQNTTNFPLYPNDTIINNEGATTWLLNIAITNAMKRM